MSLPGQVTNPLSGGGFALSGSAVVEDGARVALLRCDGVFRFDVQPQQDTLRVIFRGLAGTPVEYRETAADPVSGRCFEVQAGDREAQVQLLARRLEALPGWQLTAQAKVSGPRLRA